MSKTAKSIVVTMGEAAGIGAEITLGAYRWDLTGVSFG